MYFLAGLMTAAYMLFCGGNTIISRADEVRKTITDAKIRSEADTGSSQVGSAPQGTTFSVGEPTTGTDGKPWYQVSINGQSGYIRADLTESAGEGGAAADSEGNETSGTVAQTDITAGTIGGSSATVRQGPSTSAGKVTSADAGAVVTISGESVGDDGSTWYQVDVDGKTGFIRSDLFDENGFQRAESSEGEPGEVMEPEGSGEEGGGEEVPEAAGGSEIKRVISSRSVPGDVDIKDVDIDQAALDEWSSDTIYLLTVEDEDGEVSLYLYSLPKDDKPSKMEKLEQGGSGGGDSLSSLTEGKGKILMIVAAVLFVILIGVCIMLAVKLRGYQAYDHDPYDDDEEDEYDEYDEDDEDDEAYEDEEDEEEYDDEEYDEDGDEDEDDEDDDEYDEDEYEDERPARRRRWSPKNFLSRRDTYDDEYDDGYDEEDEDEDDEDDDEYLDDDDFEFEFLNMDDKDDF